MEFLSKHLKDITMTIIKRTCANCASFNPFASDSEGACGNLIYFTEHSGTPQALSREPGPTDWCDSHQFHDEDKTNTREFEVARHVAESTPEFLAAMSACLRLVETLGMEHPDTARAMQRAMLLSPPSLNDFMEDKAMELGLMPDAGGYTDDGAPVFSLESIAAKLGISVYEAQQAMDAMRSDRAALGLPDVLVDPAAVHLKH